MQLFYDLMFDNTLTGLPICRPLFFGAPDDEALFNDKECFLNNEFFVGRDMLVAPVLCPRFIIIYIESRMVSTIAVVEISICLQALTGITSRTILSH